MLTRSAQGGAAPSAVDAMVAACRVDATALHAEAERWRKSFSATEEALLASARAIVDDQEVAP